MNIKQIEKYIAGSDELNRKRQVITRVMRAVITCLHFAIEWEKFEPMFPPDVFSIDLPIGCLTCRAVAVFNEEASGPFSGRSLKKAEISVILKKNEVEWHLEDREVLGRIPYGLIPKLYQCLPEIVERASAVPNSRIKSEFDFFIGQAPE